MLCARPLHRSFDRKQDRQNCLKHNSAYANANEHSAYHQIGQGRWYMFHSRKSCDRRDFLFLQKERDEERVLLETACELYLRPRLYCKLGHQISVARLPWLQSLVLRNLLWFPSISKRQYPTGVPTEILEHRAHLHRRNPVNRRLEHFIISDQLSINESHSPFNFENIKLREAFPSNSSIPTKDHTEFV